MWSDEWGTDVRKESSHGGIYIGFYLLLLGPLDIGDSFGRRGSSDSLRPSVLRNMSVE